MCFRCGVDGIFLLSEYNVTAYVDCVILFIICTHTHRQKTDIYTIIMHPHTTPHHNPNNRTQSVAI